MDFAPGVSRGGRTGPRRRRVGALRPLAEVGLADPAGTRQLGRVRPRPPPGRARERSRGRRSRAPSSRSARPSAPWCRRRRSGAPRAASRRPCAAPGRARARRASAGAGRSSSPAPSPPSAARRRSSSRRAGGGARPAWESRRRPARRRAGPLRRRHQPAAELEVLGHRHLREQLAALRRPGRCRVAHQAPRSGRRRRSRHRRAGPCRGAGSARPPPSAASSCRRRSGRGRPSGRGSASRARSRGAGGRRRSRRPGLRSGAGPAPAPASGEVPCGRHHLVAEVGLERRPGCARPRPVLPVPAIFLPSCSTITHSTCFSSVVTACSIQITVEVELVAQAMHQPRHRLDLAFHGGDLVEQQPPRPGRQRHADLEQALLRRRDRGRRQRRPRPRARAGRGCSPRHGSSAGAGRLRPAKLRPKATFSATLSAANTRGVLEGAGDRALGESGAVPCRTGRSPRATARPRSAPRTPERALKKVVLPAPFGPMMPTSSPGANAALTESTAVRPPKRTVRRARLDQRMAVHWMTLRASHSGMSAWEQPGALIAASGSRRARPAGTAPRGSAGGRATSCRPAASTAAMSPPAG